MSRKIVFKKEEKIQNFEENKDNLDNIFLESNRLKLKQNRSDRSLIKTEINDEIAYDIPKMGKKLELLPPFYFQYKNSQYKKNFSKSNKTEISEPSLANSSSINTDRKPQNSVVNNRDSSKNTDCRESKRKTITDFVTFFLSDKFSCSTKIIKFFKKLLLPHIVCTFICVFAIMFQDYYNEICFIKKCTADQPDDPMSVKVFTTIKTCFMFWNLILLMGYNVIFHIDFWKTKIIFKFIYFLGSYIIIFAFYLTRSCNEEEPDFLYIFLIGFGAINIFFLIYFIKIKFDLKKLKKAILTRINLVGLIFLNYLMNFHGYKYLKKLVEMITSDPNNVYQIIVALVIFIFRTLFKSAFYQHVKSEEISQKSKLNSIGFYIRLSICIILATEISSILQLNLGEWGVWIILINHVIFMILFYTRYNFLLVFANKLIKLILKKNNYFQETEQEKMVDRVLSGYMIDFQFIFIPRIITIYFYKRWLNIHIPEFYKDCKLGISDQFKINPNMVLLLILINVLVPVVISFWMYRKGNDFLVFIPEKIHILKRAYIILMIHNYFEFMIQELRVATVEIKE